MSYFRRAIISIAEVIALISVIAFTIVGMQLGKAIAPSMAGSFVLTSHMDLMSAEMTLSWIGGLIGFLISLMLTATFLVLVEIAKNTRNAIRY
ncbi:MAG: hypothetical protein HY244_16910 [Rhizobiales bacterium]|nr:hypothetical protein [Hyphomicrobiales bacterium]